MLGILCSDLGTLYIQNNNKISYERMHGKAISLILFTKLWPKFDIIYQTMTHLALLTKLWHKFDITYQIMTKVRYCLPNCDTSLILFAKLWHELHQVIIKKIEKERLLYQVTKIEIKIKTADKHAANISCNIHLVGLVFNLYVKI